MKIYRLLSFLFVLVYTRAALERLGLPIPTVNLIVEAPLALLALVTLGTTRGRLAPGAVWVVLFVATTLVSAFCNDDSLSSAVQYFRFLVYTYLVFWAVWNAALKPQEIARLNRLILSLWVLQIVVSLFHVFVLGQRVEGHVGLITSGGGGAATAFPLFAMGYVMADYCCRNRSLKLPLLALAFSMVGYASGKRAIYFLVPSLYVGILVWHSLRTRWMPVARETVLPLLILALSVPVLVVGAQQSKKLGLDDPNAGLLDRVKYMIAFANDYESQETEHITASRTTTSSMVFRLVLENEMGLVFTGLGPSSLVGEKKGMSVLHIRYGIAGWVRDTVSIGFPGVLCQVGFFCWLWFLVGRTRHFPRRPDLESLRFGTQIGIFVFVLMYFTYVDAFPLYGWLTYPLVYYVALLLSPKHGQWREADSPAAA